MGACFLKFTAQVADMRIHAAIVGQEPAAQGAFTQVLLVDDFSGRFEQTL